MQFSSSKLMNYGLPLPQVKASDTSRPRDGRCPWSREVHCLALPTCIQWMWHSIFLCWPRKKDCVGNLENIQWGHPSILHLSINSGSQLCWWSTRGTGVHCSSPLWPRKHWSEGERDTEALFSQKGRPMDGLPPTQAAFVEHTKRAAYQSGHVWAQMFVAVPCYHLLENGGGCKQPMGVGKWSGQPFQRLLKPVVNCLDVDAFTLQEAV